jgi:DNA repair ATPase RecN
MRGLIITGIFCLVTTLNAAAQSQEMQQLILNIEKLAQFKSILEDMKKGYEILSKGYNAVKDISQGNFSLHKVFLDGLLEVSPTVQKYKRIVETVNYQLILIKEYKQALQKFKSSALFDNWELQYIEKVYNKLFTESLASLDDLLMVITSGRLRMSDAERLDEIDALYYDMEDKLVFLRLFNQSTEMLSLQRKAARKDVEAIRQYYGK